MYVFIMKPCKESTGENAQEIEIIYIYMRIRHRTTSLTLTRASLAMAWRMRSWVGSAKVWPSSSIQSE